MVFSPVHFSNLFLRKVPLKNEPGIKLGKIKVSEESLYLNNESDNSYPQWTTLLIILA